MKDTAKTSSVAQAATRPARTPYTPPELRDFGKLHLLTQGSTGTFSDGSSNMQFHIMFMPPPML